MTLGVARLAGAQPPPTLVSPEIGADRAVTFRLWAPNASTVELSGNWMGARPPVPLTKGAEVLFDNLIARGDMIPMIVVMHASDALDRPGARRFDENLKEFEAILVDEVLPMLRTRYRASRPPEDWAIAGLSLGGEFGMHVGLKHPEIFRSIASLSGSLVPNSFDSRYAPWFTTPEARRGAYRLIWLGCGSEDIFLDGTKALAARLEAAGIGHLFRQFTGPHSMAVARLELAELLPLLFKSPAAPRR